MARVAGGGTRQNMPSGRIPKKVKTQSDMYKNDGTSAFGNLKKTKAGAVKTGKGNS